MERTNLRSIWLLWAGKDDPGMIAAISETARAIKQSICANRLALFSPFYVADYGSNHCKRRRMSDREILEEALAVKRAKIPTLVLQSGEDSFFDQEKLRRLMICISPSVEENSWLSDRLMQRRLHPFIPFPR